MIYITTRWVGNAEADHYDIYRSQDPLQIGSKINLAPIAQTVDPYTIEYEDNATNSVSAPVPGTTYCYRLVAVGPFGDPSVPSTAVRFTFQGDTMEPLDLEAILDAIYDFLAGVVGSSVTVIRELEGGPVPKGDWVSFRVTGPTLRGSDDQRDGGLRQTGLRVFTAGVTASGPKANRVIGAIQTALTMTRFLRPLVAAEIAVETVGTALDLSELVNTDWTKKARLEFTFNTPIDLPALGGEISKVVIPGEVGQNSITVRAEKA